MLRSQEWMMTKPQRVLRYFTVHRNLKDGPRAFQQVFGISLEAFAADFAAYLNAQKVADDLSKTGE